MDWVYVQRRNKTRLEFFLCLSAKKGVVGDALGLAGKTLFPT